MSRLSAALDFCAYRERHGHFPFEGPAPEPTLDIPRILRASRLGRRLTQQQVAAGMGVSQFLISSWERGIREPSPEQVEAYLAVPVTPRASRVKAAGPSRQLEAGLRRLADPRVL